MENPRTASARDHDDHAIIDAASELPTPGQGGAAGGAKAQDLGAQDEEGSIADPDGHHRVTKANDIHHHDSHGSPTRSRGQSGV